MSRAGATGCVLAVDGGSQSTKVSVVGLDGTVRSSAQVALRPYELGADGSVVHPDDDLWTSLGVAARQALVGVDADDVVAVGLCGIRFCRALLDEHDRLVEPVWSWMDPRVGRPHEPDGRTDLLTTAGGYLGVRLTGERRDSAAAYQGVWPLDPTTQRWSSSASELARAGMPRALLPDLVDPGGLLGEVTATAAAQTGIPVGLPVYATANDKAVEALGCGLVDADRMLLSLGTYVAAMVVGDPPSGASSDASADPRCWVNAHAVTGRRLLESAGVRRGMWTVSWLRDLVGSATSEPPADADVLAWLEAGATDVPRGCDGLLTVPDWLPPPEAPHRRGAFLGLQAAHGPHHLYRSVLEALVLTMRTHAAAMEEALDRTSSRLVVSGGGSRSALMCRIAADAFGVPVERAAVPDAAGLGAAICAAVGHGLHTDVETAVAAMVRPGDVVHPDPAGVREYDALRRLHVEVSDLLDPVLRRVARDDGTQTPGPG